MSFGEEEHRDKVPFPSHDIKGTYYWNDVIVNINLGHLD